jgi:ribosomal protein S18 acetylase RimI-like enzyme
VSLDLPVIPVDIRPFQPADASLCQRLYSEGLIGGKIADNDTGLDIDDIPGAYLNTGGAFWVAINPEAELVGMIGVQQHEHGEGEIRRLRVRQDHRRRGIGTRLLERAIGYCKDRQYLKVTLDTFIDREPALRLFEKFKFKHSRTRELGDKTLLYFYLDLYSSDQTPKRAS